MPKRKASKKKKGTGIFYRDTSGVKREYTKEQIKIFKRLAGNRKKIEEIEPKEEKVSRRPVIIDLSPKIPWEKMTLKERAKELQRVWRILDIDKNMKYKDYLKIVTPVSIEGMESLFRQLKDLSREDQINLFKAFARRADKKIGKELKKVIEEFKKREREEK